MSFLSRISEKLFGNSGQMKGLQAAAEKRKSDKEKREAKRKKENSEFRSK